MGLDIGAQGNTDRGESDQFRFGENGVWQESPFSQGFKADVAGFQGQQAAGEAAEAEA